MLAFIFSLLFVIVVGLAFAGLAGGLLHIVITFEIFTLSALVAWYNKSVSLGAKWFLQLIFVVPGMMVGVLGCFVYQWLFNESLSFTHILLTGIAVGALGGFLTGSIAFYGIRIIIRRASSMIKRNS